MHNPVSVNKLKWPRGAGWVKDSSDTCSNTFRAQHCNNDIDLSWLPPKEDEVLETDPGTEDAEDQIIYDSSSSSRSASYLFPSIGSNNSLFRVIVEALAVMRSLMTTQRDGGWVSYGKGCPVRRN